MHYVLAYDYDADVLERRIALRAEHLALTWRYQASGDLVLGGVLDDPVDGALMLFQGPSPDVAHAFVAADPYVRNGLVKSWRVGPWHAVLGDAATEPICV